MGAAVSSTLGPSRVQTEKTKFTGTPPLTAEVPYADSPPGSCSTFEGHKAPHCSIRGLIDIAMGSSLRLREVPRLPPQAYDALKCLVATLLIVLESASASGSPDRTERGHHG